MSSLETGREQLLEEEMEEGPEEKPGGKKILNYVYI